MIVKLIRNYPEKLFPNNTHISQITGLFQLPERKQKENDDGEDHLNIRPG